MAGIDDAATGDAAARQQHQLTPMERVEQHDAQPHKERSSKPRGRDREPDEDRDTERHRRRRTDGERYLDRESGHDRGDQSRDRDRDHHHREHRERSERREHRDRSDDCGYRRSRDRDAERGDRDRGDGRDTSEAILMAALPAVPAPIPGMLPNMLPNMYNLPNLGQPQHMTQQATRHARRVYVDGLSPSANEQAALLGPSQPNPNLNLAAVGLTPGLGGGLEGPDRIFVGGLPYYITEDQVRELLEKFGPLRGFDIVKDKETGNSKGYAFCLYKDVSVTDIACAALNGIKMGDMTLTVRRANQGSAEPRPEQESILLQAQQEAQMKVEELTQTNVEYILWRSVFDPGYTLPSNIHKLNPNNLRDFEAIMRYATPDVAYFLYHQPVKKVSRSIGNKSGERWRQIGRPILGTICTRREFKVYKDSIKLNGRMEEFVLQVNKEEQNTENLVLCKVYAEQKRPLPLHEEVGVETLQKEEEHLQEMIVQWTAKISHLEEELKAAREVASKALQKEEEHLQEMTVQWTAKISHLEEELKAAREVASKMTVQWTAKISHLEEELKAAREVASKQNEIIQDLNRCLIEVKHQIVEGDNLRKKQHDRILVLKGNLRVFVRVKPLQKKINSNGMQIEPVIACTKLKESPDYTVGVNGKVYAFDKVFDHKASQEDVFVEMAELVQSVLDGENVSIFTYGQTGSGKTYTMIGELGDQAGIIPRSLKQILIAKESKEKAGWKISLKVSVLEFYNDESKDLLGESVNIVNSDSDVAYYVQLVKKNRSVATTNMNKASSRSHLVFSLHVSQSNEDTKVESTINLIDLAGSERLPKSGSEGEQKKEAMAINVSLSALGRVLAAIARKENHIPWRDSKLTHYLKPCLEENSKKVMLVNVSSEEEQMSETTSSLMFASLVNRTDVVPAPGGKHKCGKNKNNMFSPTCEKSKSALHKRKAPFLSPAQSRLKTCVRN